MRFVAGFGFNVKILDIARCVRCVGVGVVIIIEVDSHAVSSGREINKIGRLWAFVVVIRVSALAIGVGFCCVCLIFGAIAFRYFFTPFNLSRAVGSAWDPAGGPAATDIAVAV